MRRARTATLLAWLLAAACGTSGELGPGDVADVGPRPNTSPLCPPTDPQGLALGQIIPDVALRDCEGNDTSLHALCPRKAGYFFVYADW